MTSCGKESIGRGNATTNRGHAPAAEWVARILWTRRPVGDHGPATRLTQSRRREARGGIPSPPASDTIRPAASVCRICGTSIPAGRSYCSPCSVSTATERMPEVARSGRIAAHSAEAEASRSAQRRNALARWEWQRSSDVAGIDEKTFDTKIHPQLKRLTNAALASAIGVSLYYAAEIRRGRRPHPRHWQALAQLVIHKND